MINQTRSLYVLFKVIAYIFSPKFSPGSYHVQKGHLVARSFVLQVPLDFGQQVLLLGWEILRVVVTALFQIYLFLFFLFLRHHTVLQYWVIHQLKTIVYIVGVVVLDLGLKGANFLVESFNGSIQWGFFLFQKGCFLLKGAGFLLEFLYFLVFHQKFLMELIVFPFQGLKFGTAGESVGCIFPSTWKLFNLALLLIDLLWEIWPQLLEFFILLENLAFQLFNERSLLWQTILVIGLEVSFLKFLLQDANSFFPFDLYLFKIFILCLQIVKLLLGSSISK